MKAPISVFSIFFLLSSTLGTWAQASVPIAFSGWLVGYNAEQEQESREVPAIAEILFLGGAAMLVAGGIIVSQANSTAGMVLVFLDEKSNVAPSSVLSETLRLQYPEIQDKAIYEALGNRLVERYETSPERFESSVNVNIRDVTVPAEEVVALLAPLDLSAENQARIIQGLSL